MSLPSRCPAAVSRAASPVVRTASGRALPWILGLLLALGAGGAWWFQGQRGDGAAAAPPARVQPVSVAQVRRQDIRVTVQAIGTIAAAHTAVVRPRIEGELRAIHFKEGQAVQAGALLAELDDRALRIALAQAEGQLERDQAQLDNARLDLARFRELLTREGISRQQVDTQEALVRQLQGTVQTDRAQVEQARLQLSHTRIVAPISGQAGLRQADLGNLVRPGDAGGLLTIAQIRPAHLVFAVPEIHKPRIVEALRAGRALPVEAWDRGQSQRLALGRVESSDNAIDSATGTLKLKAVFPNEDGRLFPNQFVNVRLQLDTVEDTLAVPAAALLRRADGPYVYRVEEGLTVSVRPVQAGATEGDWVAVQGGLEPGDTVVVDGVDRLREGARVQVIRTQDAGGRDRQPPSGDKGRAPASAASAASPAPDAR